MDGYLLLESPTLALVFESKGPLVSKARKPFAKALQEKKKIEHSSDESPERVQFSQVHNICIFSQPVVLSPILGTYSGWSRQSY